MEVRNTTIESFLKSVTFSVLLCLFCVFLAFINTRSLLKGFDFFELLHVIFNVAVASLFLIRVRPSVVSMNLVHWTIALITSLSGFLLLREGMNSHFILLSAADALISFGAFVGLVAALTLGRSFGFLPALRHVRTEYVYQIVRHPMYLFGNPL